MMVADGCVVMLGMAVVLVGGVVVIVGLAIGCEVAIEAVMGW